MFKLNSVNKKIAFSGIVAGLYVVLSLAVLPLSSGAVQIRISEGLTVLPLFIPESVFGVFIGCFLSNLISGCVIYDVIFGSLITLLSATLTYLIGVFIKNKKIRFIVGGIFPILLNAFLLPFVWVLAYGFLEYLYIEQVALIFVGEIISVYGVGYFVYKGTEIFINKK